MTVGERVADGVALFVCLPILCCSLTRLVLEVWKLFRNRRDWRCSWPAPTGGKP